MCKNKLSSPSCDLIKSPNGFVVTPVTLPLLQTEMNVFNEGNTTPKSPQSSNITSENWMFHVLNVGCAFTSITLLHHNVRVHHDLVSVHHSLFPCALYKTYRLWKMGFATSMKSSVNITKPLQVKRIKKIPIERWNLSFCSKLKIPVITSK